MSLYSVYQCSTCGAKYAAGGPCPMGCKALTKDDVQQIARETWDAYLASERVGYDDEIRKIADEQIAKALGSAPHVIRDAALEEAIEAAMNTPAAERIRALKSQPHVHCYDGPNGHKCCDCCVCGARMGGKPAPAQPSLRTAVHERIAHGDHFAEGSKKVAQPSAEKPMSLYEGLDRIATLEKDRDALKQKLDAAERKLDEIAELASQFHPTQCKCIIRALERTGRLGGSKEGA